ncbi:prepilin-type N-terminal cleavage/methylation domain-containing protein [Paracraurococcus ruber]|uniref:Prepilin-type N-terminal cleavage/methylation domain-containing protein n=1 Tax=Paracraurococcus ruber TaxID=77675 RepID=A0ABS1D8C0_9PROT|nr:prepilin-type N-terminal cleavage/methylation domain-containing protein [Paracraurococcus ruber]MBK1662695.1 hypothetical protein [Paracraurococcus ruber]TDG07182.1 prepilin-type N-terminal cleavage/methylation domain-containing protein [Paracraurococcus ruber]
MTRPGFTLVETLVGLVLLGLVAALGLAGLGLVGRAGASAAPDAATLLLAQDQLRARLVGALPLLAEGPGGLPTLLFEGGADHLAFVADLPPRFGVAGPAWLELRREEAGLLLRWRPLAGAASGEGAAGRPLVAGLAGLRLRYFGTPRGEDPPGWRADWSGATRLPRLIALDAEFPPGDARAWPALVVAPRLAAGGAP